MQFPAGLDLPHTRARTVHWVTTAAALAAVTGVAVVVQPSDATANAPAASAPGPDASDAAYPLDCGPHPILVTEQVSVDFDDDGHPETVAAVRCDAGGGTPPSGLYVLTEPARPGGAPRIAETLVDPAEGMTVDGLEAAASGPYTSARSETRRTWMHSPGQSLADSATSRSSGSGTGAVAPGSVSSSASSPAGAVGFT